MNGLKTSGLTWLILLAGAMANAAGAGEIRGLPGGQAVYNNGYYGAAPSYAYAAPQTAYYAPAYQQGYPVRQAYYPNGVAVAPSAQAGRVAYYYAPSNPGYAITPAGSGGAESYSYYGQQQPLNYIPPTYRYETRMVAVPVTYYRPVVVYQPGAVAPTTCQRACTSTQCQPQRFRLFNWFGSNSSNTCNYGSCSSSSCAPAAAVAGCGAAPYYNTVPGTTAPAVVYPSTPSTTAPRGFNNILTPRTTVPPPGTGVIGVPADNAPAISPGTVIPSSPPAIRGTTPGTSTPVPPSSFGTPPSSGFGSGTPPTFGSSFRSNSDKPKNDIQLSRPTITEPGMKQPEASAPPSTLRAVPDPEAGLRTKPGSRAPALINPNDKTAQSRTYQPLGAATWGVVPARWPEKTHQVNYKVETASAEMAIEKSTERRLQTPAAKSMDEKWDDSGWKSAR